MTEDSLSQRNTSAVRQFTREKTLRFLRAASAPGRRRYVGYYRRHRPRVHVGRSRYVLNRQKVRALEQTGRDFLRESERMQRLFYANNLWADSTLKQLTTALPFRDALNGLLGADSFQSFQQIQPGILANTKQQTPLFSELTRAFNEVIQQVNEQVRRSRQAIDLIVKQNGPGTISHDLFLARRGDSDASWRLAERLMSGWTPDPKAGAALRATARERGSTQAREKQIALQRAVIHVTQYADQEVFVRLGEGGDIEKNGITCPLIPHEFSSGWYWVWVQREVPKAATADVLGIAYRPDEADVRTSNALNNALSHRDISPGDQGAAMLRNMELREQILEILDRSTSIQQALIVAFLRAGTTAQAARDIGIEPNAGKQMMYRLQKREQAQQGT